MLSLCGSLFLLLTGRVNAMLERRLQLLSLVEKLAKALGVAEDVAYTCETSAHFWLLHVLSRWEKFSASVEKLKLSADANIVSGHFPFHAFFADAPHQPIFSGASFEADLEKAKGCFKVRGINYLSSQGSLIDTSSL